MKQSYPGVIFFGITEITIGALTLIAVLASLFLGTSSKPTEVLVFVLVSAMISLSLGIGILRTNLTSYHLVLFFSTTVIFSKILIFAKIISLSGALEIAIHSAVKDTVSVIYHSLLILYFIRPAVRGRFGERRNVLFSLKVPFLK